LVTIKRAWNYLLTLVYKGLNRIIILNARNSLYSRERKKAFNAERPNTTNEYFFDIQNAFETNTKLETAEFNKIAFVCLFKILNKLLTQFIFYCADMYICDRFRMSTMRSHATLIIVRLIKSSELYKDNKRSISFRSD